LASSIAFQKICRWKPNEYWKVVGTGRFRGSKLTAFPALASSATAAPCYHLRVY